MVVRDGDEVSVSVVAGEAESVGGTNGDESAGAAGIVGGGEGADWVGLRFNAACIIIEEGGVSCKSACSKIKYFLVHGNGNGYISLCNFISETLSSLSIKTYTLQWLFPNQDLKVPLSYLSE